TSISMTDDNGKTITYDLLKKGNDECVDKATVSSNNSRTKTYSLTEESVAPIFKSITSRTVGTTSLITFNFTKEGVEKFKEITTRAASSSSKTIYFFVGDRQLINFSCESAVSEKSFSLQASDKLTAQNSAITLNSAVNGGALELNYQDIESIVTSSATGGENASLFAFISCVLVLAGLCVFYIVKFKKLGAVMSLISAAFALVELYALFLLSIQVTFAVILAAMLCLGLYAVSNGVLLTEIKRLTQTGRTMQASVKEGYKNVLMSVTDLHIVLVIVAILLATVGVGEVAACGLISVVGVVASYVLYWFTRFMWYATSSSTRDKFGFAGLKRAVEDDE
ncbi:MAG: hypothetical protein K2N14_03850, partial [Clostridia bacterium]|nr:hypothetical protein [Clostridia bacterium]